MSDLIKFKKPYSLFFGEIAGAAKDGDSKMTVGVAIWMSSPSASEWVGANCSGEKPFFLTTSGDGKIANLLYDAIGSCPEGRYIVSDIWVGVYTESGEAAEAQDRVEKYLHSPGLLSESIRID